MIYFTCGKLKFDYPLYSTLSQKVFNKFVKSAHTKLYLLLEFSYYFCDLKNGGNR